MILCRGGGTGGPSIQCQCLPSVAYVHLYRVQTSNANDYPRCSRRHCAIPSVTNACIRLSRNLPRESSLSNHSILPPLLCSRHNYPYIAAKLRPHFVGRRERRRKERCHIDRTSRQVYTRCRLATKHKRFFITFYSLRPLVQKDTEEIATV